MLFLPPTIMSGAATWQTVVNNASLNADQASWASFTINMFIPQASLLVTGGSSVRVTCFAPTVGNQLINKMYIGQASAGYTTTSPAFSGTPTQIFFGGGFAALSMVAGGGDSLSDAVSFVMPSSNGICIAWEHSATATSVRTSPAGSPTNWKWSYKSGTDAATVAKSLYTDYSATNGSATIHLVEELI